MQDVMETPQISRSGRVLKKSAKVKEMEDLDINELEMQGKARKKSKAIDDYDEFDDKRVAPIKIPKISLNLSPAPKRKITDVTPTLSKLSFPSTAKSKQDPKRSLYQESSSPEASKESESSSATSETSSSSPSSSDDSDSDGPEMHQRYTNADIKPSFQGMQHMSQDKNIVEQYRQFSSPVAFVDHNSEMPMDASEDETSDSGLVIAEESNDSPGFMSRGQKAGVPKKRAVAAAKKDPTYAPRRGSAPKKRPPSRNPRNAKRKKPAGKSKPLTAYMLWCSENRKRIAATMGNIGFGHIGKKMGEAWQALPDKEKMAWRRKAKRLALKNSGGLISTGPTNGSSPKSSNRISSSVSDDSLRGLSEGSRTLGTSAIDAAAYLKLLGESLSVIGQRLTEHEGQLAVSGIFSVLLDTILCVVGPLLCLASETPVLNSCPPEVSSRTLDSIAYFMPGL